MKLRTKSSILLALIVVMILGVSGAVYLHLLEQALRESVFSGLQGISQTASTYITQWLQECLRDTRAIAYNLPENSLRERNAAAIEEYLKSMQVIFPKFDNGMFLLDSEGTLWTDYPIQPATRGKSFAFREYFKRTMEEGNGIVGIPYRSARTGEPVVTFTAILRGPSGETTGLLACSARLLTDQALGGIRRQNIGKKGYIYVYDRSRLMILHPVDERVLARDVPLGANKIFDAAIEGFQGVGETINSLGIRMLISISNVAATDWIVGAQQPVAEAFASLFIMRRRLIIGTALGGVAALLLGLLAVRRVTLPLALLHQVALQLRQRLVDGLAASDVVESDLDEKLEQMERNDETGDLLRTMKDLSTSLDQSMHSLRQSERRYRKLFEMAQDGFFVVSQEGLVIDCNRAAARLFKASRQELLNKHPSQCSPARQPDDRLSMEREHEIIDEVLQGRPQRFEWLYQTADGDLFNAEVSMTLVSSGDERHLLASIRDITAQKHAQVLLRQERERLAAILDGIPVATFLVDLEREVVLWNRACEIMTGVSRELILGKPLDDKPALVADCLPVFAEPLLQLSEEEILERYGGGRNRFVAGLGTLEVRDSIIAGGEKKIVKIMATRLVDDEGRLQGVIQCIQDITREEALQKQLLQASKMESIGTMAGGMAHEFNNIVAAILGHAELLSVKISSGEARKGIRAPDAAGGAEASSRPRWSNTTQRDAQVEWPKSVRREETSVLRRGAGPKPPSGQPLWAPRRDGNPFAPDDLLKHVKQIQDGCQRAAALTRSMLTFARSDGGEMLPVNVNILLGNLQPLLRQTLPPSIELKLGLASDLFVVRADPNQLEQVVVNLVLNARDAIAGCGEIHIHTRRAEVLPDSPRYLGSSSPDSKAPLVEIEISDTGEGISADLLPKVFDPFFTTKEPGKGTGLGLSIVYSIVQAHGGCVKLDSRRGRGSRFRVYLPLIEEGRGLPEDTFSSHSPSVPRGAGQAVLLVDDEEQIRDVVSEMLVSLGYKVECADDGKQGVSLYQEALEDGEPFALVILDLAMPVMSGGECLARLLAIDSNARVVVASGLVEDGREQREDLPPQVKAVIRKPFEIRSLATKLHNALR